MSQEQRDAVDQMMRHWPLDLGGDVVEQRAIFAQMIAGIPLAADVVTTQGTLGGIPVVGVDVAGVVSGNVLFYLHGGAYAVGTAAASAGLASDLVRRALATLVAAGMAGLPQPSSAVVFSPWADLTLSGASLRGKAEVDPVLTPGGLRRRAADYAGGDLSDPLVSPVFADLAGLPPLLIQAGSHEILLDDATRIAVRAAAADVPITLEVTPGVPHVFQSFSAVLDEADAALNSAGAFIRRHFAD